MENLENLDTHFSGENGHPLLMAHVQAEEKWKGNGHPLLLPHVRTMGVHFSSFPPLFLRLPFRPS